MKLSVAYNSEQPTVHTTKNIKIFTHPVLILQYVFPNRCQCRPFTVISGTDCTALVSFKFTHCTTHTYTAVQNNLHSEMMYTIRKCVIKSSQTFTGQPVRRDPRQRLPADVTVCGASVWTGVPVMHPREVIHTELCGLDQRNRYTIKGQRSSEAAWKWSRFLNIPGWHNKAFCWNAVRYLQGWSQQILLREI